MSQGLLAQGRVTSLDKKNTFSDFFRKPLSEREHGEE